MNSEKNFNQTEDSNQTAKQVTYADYSELTNFNSNSEINKAINNVKIYLTDINADWICQFDSINDLRRMNKYQPKLFLELFAEVVLEFVKLVVSIRSNIAKLALILLKEFFANKIYFDKNYVSEENNGNGIISNNNNFSNNEEFEFGNNNINNAYNNFNSNNSNSNTNSNVCNNRNNNLINSSPKSHYVGNSNRLSNFSVISNANNNNNNNNFSSNRHTEFIRNSNRLSEFSNNGNFTPVKNSNFNNNNSANNNYFDFKVYNHQINSIFDTVIPYVLQQSCTMKAFLKDEANRCLDKISSCTKSFYFLKKINMQINNKNASYAENAFLTAQALMQNLLTDPDHFDMQDPSNKSLQSVKELIEINLGLYNLKKDLYAKKAVKLLTLLKELIGAECFEALKGCFDNVAKGVIDNMIREGNKPTKNTGNFKDFVRSKK